LQSLAEKGPDDQIIVIVALAELAGAYFFLRRRGGV
jgi:hypothetical protein